MHSQSPGVQGARAASFVHHNRFAELSGDDTVSVLPQGVPGVVETAQANPVRIVEGGGECPVRVQTLDI